MPKYITQKAAMERARLAELPTEPAIPRTKRETLAEKAQKAEAMLPRPNGWNAPSIKIGDLPAGDLDAKAVAQITGQRCETCAFASFTRGRHPDYRLCRISAPKSYVTITVDGHAMARARWLTVDAHDVCGEWTEIDPTSR